MRSTTSFSSCFRGFRRGFSDEARLCGPPFSSPHHQHTPPTSRVATRHTQKVDKVCVRVFDVCVPHVMCYMGETCVCRLRRRRSHFGEGSAGEPSHCFAVGYSEYMGSCCMCLFQLKWGDFMSSVCCGRGTVGWVARMADVQRRGVNVGFLKASVLDGSGQHALGSETFLKQQKQSGNQDYDKRNPLICDTRDESTTPARVEAKRRNEHDEMKETQKKFSHLVNKIQKGKKCHTPRIIAS
jgi:hypothetical protein